MSVFRNLLMQSTGWLGKPADWSDIRKDCPANSIALYAGHTADYSQYDNLGFTATVSNSGQYKVYIDGTLYNTYASGAQCTITWSTSGITTGDDITTPTALKAHKIWIEPAIEGNTIENIVQSYSSSYQTGLLWAHFNLTNQIAFNPFFATGSSPTFSNRICKAFTAKNNKVFVKGTFTTGFWNCLALEYIPNLDLSNANATNSYYGFRDCKVLEKINIVGGYITPGDYYFSGASLLKKLPKNLKYNYLSNTAVRNYVAGCVSLEDTYLDMSEGTRITRLTLGGTLSVPLPAIKGLRVSNEGLFNSATSPQIDVSYTGMDRQALVQLFNDLPTVSDGQIINITGTTGSEDLTMEDIDIADSKGWTITGGPTPVQVYAYTDGNGNTIYTPDENLQGTFKEFNSNDFVNSNIEIIDGKAIIENIDSTKSIYTANDFDPSSQNWKIHIEYLYKGDNNYYIFLYPKELVIKGFVIQFNTSGHTIEALKASGGSWQTQIYSMLTMTNNPLIANTYYSTEVGRNDSYIFYLAHSEGSVINPTLRASNNLSVFDGCKFNFGWHPEAAPCEIELSKSYFQIANSKITMAIMNTTSVLYDGNGNVITEPAENYNNVIVVDGTTYTRDSSKDKTAVLPN